MDHLVVVPATSANLGAGFDTLGVALGRHLRVATGRAGGARVVVRSGESAGLATDDDNLVWRAFVTGCDHLDHPVPDLRLDVDNAVPLERGLGSSSSAIVAGLVLARAVARAEVADDHLVRWATELEGHPDNVAPALLGGLVTTATGTDGLVVRRARPAPGVAPIVAVPVERSRTAESRGVLPDQLGRSDLVEQLGRLSHVVGGLLGAWPLDASLAGDVFHEGPRIAGQPAAAVLLEGWRRAGTFAVLSGAGPTVLALVDARPDRIAAAVATATRTAAETDLEVEVAPLSWDLAGARWRPRRS